eukprot:TRINITY_DN5099_c0_g1_i4.p1 TRINITY_DN5099_c0_g1~~TRINITY_DN5099_c0_g1_i4.p1  ORF type:complete len:268 (-),score=56.31 TRINITY_DN5099_c0_g1_i4:19-822(-)
MDLESGQAELLEQFCLLAKSTRGRGTAELVSQAIGEPGLFAFGELLDLQQLFAYGTWSDYKDASSRLPALQPAQELKLKQLTVMTLAEGIKVLTYDLLMKELDLMHVRELEDFLINDCLYAGIVRGKLDQQRRWFEVQSSAGRDLRPGQLGSLISSLSEWLGSSETLLQTIEDKIRWADVQAEKHAAHKKAVEDKVADIKKQIQSDGDSGGRLHSDAMFGDSPMMDFAEESERVRPKRFFWSPHGRTNASFPHLILASGILQCKKGA